MLVRTLLLVACGVIAATALPLILKMVPPNSVYGFRTPLTLSDPGIWFPVNVFTGWSLLAACAASASLLCFFPAALNQRPFLALGAFVAPLAGALLASFVYLSHLK